MIVFFWTKDFNPVLNRFEVKEGIEAVNKSDEYDVPDLFLWKLFVVLKLLVVVSGKRFTGLTNLNSWNRFFAKLDSSQYLKRRQSHAYYLKVIFSSKLQLKLALIFEIFSTEL